MNSTHFASEAAIRPTTLDQRVADFLAQRRIAVAGVSRDDRHHPAANLIYRRFKKDGHQVFAVNPNMDRFEGDPCYPDVRSIPGGVDGVVIITRPEITERIVRDCHAAGIRRVWMHQSSAQTTSVSREAVRYCREYDLDVIAGACPMMFGPGVDIGHWCMRGMLKLTGKMPT
jgi:predicted CoA-binding protein